MPASTLEPVSAALRNALSQNTSEDFLSSQLSGSSKRILNSNIELETTKNYQHTVLNNLKTKYIVLHQPTKTIAQNNKKTEMDNEETLSTPQKILFPLDQVQLGWSNSDWSVGAGMVNMGNTCYLNSTLQALFHVPALVNWLLSDKKHMVKCEDAGGGQGGCIICAMSKTLQASQQRNANAIRPWLVYSKLRIVCRHLVPGRQEDAHEFLRYLVEAMERAFIQRFRSNGPLDIRSKETTPLNQILGGYLRSAVRCLECGHVSTTFQHFQDLLLDIRKVNTLDDALDLYFSREKLDDLAYHCENCQKKVLATKQFSLERAPMVLCIQLKRFSVSNNKITKHITFRQRLELTRFARRKTNVPLVYRLVSMVTHVGQTVGCGHYTAVAQAPTGNFYQFDDSLVRPISQQSVFGTNAYIMLYELEHSTSSPNKTPVPNKNFNTNTNNNNNINNKTIQIQKGDEIIKDTSNILNNSNSTHINGVNIPKNSNPITVHNNNNNNNNNNLNTPSFSQNGNGNTKDNGNGSSGSGNGNGRCLNGNTDSTSASDSDDSETPATLNGNGNGSATNTPQKSSKASSSSSSSTSSNNSSPKNSPKSNTTSPNSSLSSFNSTLNSPKSNYRDRDRDRDDSIINNTQITSTDKCTTSVTQLQSILKKDETGTGTATARHKENVNVTKLVPYEVDDSSSSIEDTPATSSSTTAAVRSQIVTKAGSGSWQISPNTFHGPSHEGQTGWRRREREAVTELMHMSHEGYSAPVTTWNGTRATLDREVNNERREDRKRTLNDTNPDKCKVKQAKHSNNSYMGSKSNPGYNPFQEYSNNRKWQNDSHYYKKSHYNGMGHRYQRRGNYHNNRHRDKFRL